MSAPHLIHSMCSCRHAFEVLCSSVARRGSDETGRGVESDAAVPRPCNESRPATLSRAGPIPGSWDSSKDSWRFEEPRCPLVLILHGPFVLRPPRSLPPWTRRLKVPAWQPLSGTLEIP